MSKLILPMALFCFCTTLPGQNLVLNPSFEEMTGCPSYVLISYLGSIDSAKHWTQPYYSSDYFHPCGTSQGFGIPKNNFGYQLPRTGVAYAGICAYRHGSSEPPDYREYIVGTLFQPLQTDSVYLVKINVCLAENEGEGGGGCDRLGAYFSKDLIKYNIFPPEKHDVLPFKPQVGNPEGLILGDTARWVTICGYFKATGGEQYITIGNFYANLQTNLEQLGSGSIVYISYFFIDDVSVEQVPFHRSPFRIADKSVICQADSILVFTANEGLEQILWSTGDTTRHVSIQGAGDYWVRGMEGECFFTDSFSIHHVPPPVFQFATDSSRLCSTALPLSLQTSDCCAHILWSTGDTTSSTQVTQAGWIWVKESNACGQIQDSMYLSVSPPAHLDLGRDTALCDTTFFLRDLLAPADMDAYRWSTGETGQVISITQPGVFWAEVEHVCGTFRDTVTVQDLRSIVLNLSADTTLCLLEPLYLQAEPSFDTYLWSTGEKTAEIAVKDYGVYRVAVTNACGTQVDSLRVLESNRPLLSLPLVRQLTLGDSVQLLPVVEHDKPVSYLWLPAEGLSCVDCPVPFAYPHQSVKYLLTVTDALGCSASAETSLLVEVSDRLYLPNAFSPNGDGENDHLVMSFGREVAEVMSAQVYSRWGELLVERRGVVVDSRFELWDGTYKGQATAPGVYTLVMRLRMIDGRGVHIAGDVALIR